MDVKLALSTYQSVKSIGGWFSKEAALLFAIIDETQKKEGISGDIFEIGVHHGKSGVFLARTLQTGETLGVCDLFGNQGDNVSQSGKGDQDIFEGNLKRVAPNITPKIFAKSSAELTPEEIGTNYRIFHVDGGHNADEALNDLEVARATTVDKGVILVDDPMTYVWPGVAEGIFLFLQKYPEYEAFVAGFNKMGLVKKEHADLYLKDIDNEKIRVQYKLGVPWSYKQLPFCGTEIRIFFMPTYFEKGGLRTQAIKYVHKKRQGKRVKS